MLAINLQSPAVVSAFVMSAELLRREEKIEYMGNWRAENSAKVQADEKLRQTQRREDRAAAKAVRQTLLETLTQVCAKCSKEKTLSAFGKTRSSDCRKCVDNSYTRDPEKRAVSAAKYQESHREQRKNAGRDARAADPDKFRKRDKDRRLQTTLREREFYARPEKRTARQAYFRADYAADPKKYIVRVANRRAKKLAAPGVCTADQLKARFEVYGNCCAYCGAPAVAGDHVKPLHLGGSNWPANIRPACKSCNSSKGAKKLSVWKAEQSVV